MWPSPAGGFEGDPTDWFCSPEFQETANPAERIINWTTIFNELTWPAVTAWAPTEPGDEERSGDDTSTPTLHAAWRYRVLLAHASGADDG
jgi:hypothetical protein